MTELTWIEPQARTQNHGCKSSVGSLEELKSLFGTNVEKSTCGPLSNQKSVMQERWRDTNREHAFSGLLVRLRPLAPPNLKSWTGIAPSSLIVDDTVGEKKTAKRQHCRA